MARETSTKDEPAAIALARTVVRVLAECPPQAPLADAYETLAQLLADQHYDQAAGQLRGRAAAVYDQLSLGQRWTQDRRPTPIVARKSREHEQTIDNGTADRYAIGVTVLREELIGVLTDAKGRILDVQQQLLIGRMASEIASEIATLTKGLVEAAREVDEEVDAKIVGLGVELGGHVDSEAGEVVFYNPNRSDAQDKAPSQDLPWREVPFARQLREATGFNSLIENDANALAVYELRFGDGQTEDFAVLIIRDGIGCGLVLRNELYRGVRGAAGEIGHTAVPNGRECTSCRDRGCLDSVASVAAILARIGELKGQPPIADLDTAIQLLGEPDVDAWKVLHDAGEALAQATSNVLNLFNPGRVILRAPEQMLQSHPFVEFLEAFDNLSKKSGFSTTYEDCEFRPSAVRLTDGALGVAMLAFERLASIP
jgi:predicted NBD/HSP70 family sugar kinase